MKAAESKPENPSPPRRRRRFGLLAILVGLLPVVAVEIGLRIAGVGQDTHDPYAEFGGDVPVFTREKDVYRTAKAREPFLAPQSFPATKGEGAYRIFCFGGSTVHGRPYQVDTAFPKWLELELSHRDSSREYEVINCGGISYASFRIVPMVREVLAYEPDAIILATGHNEFLEDRTYHQLKERSWLRQRLDGLRIVSVGRDLFHREKHKPLDKPREGGFETRLDNLNGYASYHRDEEWHAAVMGQFEESVGEIVNLCRQQKVPLILVQLGSNLRDCPPFKSEHRDGLSVEDEQAWQELFEKASKLEDSDMEGALENYHKASEIDGEFALLSYRMAKVTDRLGRGDNLEARYLTAKDHDICPLRLSEGQHRFLDQVANEPGVTLVNARRAIATLSPQGIPGFDWYLDHVHPTIAGHQKIAQEIFAKIDENGLVSDPALWGKRERAAVYQRHFESLNPRYLKDGARRLEWLDNWARREKLAAEVKPRDWTDHFRLGVRRLDFGAEEAARNAFAEALRLGGEAARERAKAQGMELVHQGRSNAAVKLLKWVEGSSVGR